MVGPDDVDVRSDAGNDDVPLREDVGQAVQTMGASATPFGEGLRIFDRSIDDVDPFDAARTKSSDRQLTRLTGSDDDEVLRGEILKDLPGQSRRDR